jgi:hypothetical protein
VESPHYEVRDKALRKCDDQELYKKVVFSDPHWSVRDTAAYHITDEMYKIVYAQKINDRGLALLAAEGVKTEKGKVVVKSLIRMLKDIDYKIVFEGIETELQYELARDYECDLIQGYIIDKPIPVSKFEERYNKQHRQRD